MGFPDFDMADIVGTTDSLGIIDAFTFADAEGSWALSTGSDDPTSPRFSETSALPLRFTFSNAFSFPLGAGGTTPVFAASSSVALIYSIHTFPQNRGPFHRSSNVFFFSGGGGGGGGLVPDVVSIKVIVYRDVMTAKKTNMVEDSL
jgi:hypothetical protein